MTQLKFALLLVVALVPFSISGCGGSGETTVVPAAAAPEMSDEDYDKESMGGTAAASDESQN